MNNNIKTSLIIPVLNAEKTLSKCLSSVAIQDCDNYEIIVVDNGSTDGTRKIIHDFAEKFTNIRYVFEAKRGRGQARNAGVFAAQGEVIAMTDADCIVERDWLRRLTEPILASQAVATSGFEKDASGNYWSKMRQADDWRFVQPKIKDGYIDHLDTKNFAIRADVLKRLKFNPDLIACEDWDLFIRLKLEGVKINFITDLLVSHYHDASVAELIKTQFVQGKNASIVLSSYHRDADFLKVFGPGESANFFNWRNFLLFIPWTIWQFIFHSSAAPYRVLADLSWKIGVISFKLSRLKMRY